MRKERTGHTSTTVHDVQEVYLEKKAHTLTEGWSYCRTLIAIDKHGHRYELSLFADRPENLSSKGGREL